LATFQAADIAAETDLTAELCLISTPAFIPAGLAIAQLCPFRAKSSACFSSQPDLVFLDVQMPEMDGFEVLRRIDLERMPAVIFVTAYDRYALRAFDANALDYLLKPFGHERFERALGRAKERIAGNLSPEETRRILAALEQVHAQNGYAEPLPIAESGRITFVSALDIDWIEAEGN
jgi:two-component system, LytTR family, response regulator